MEHINVVLLQRVRNLGLIGDVVKVKPGFARNYLLPKKIALRATKENMKYFEDQRLQIEAHNASTRAEAQKIAEKVKRFSVNLVRQASEKGHLYGSVTSKDIATAVKHAGVTIVASQISLRSLIKTLGIYELTVDLHPEVSVPLRLSVAKSEEEAQQQMIAANKNDANETSGVPADKNDQDTTTSEASADAV